MSEYPQIQEGPVSKKIWLELWNVRLAFLSYLGVAVAAISLWTQYQIGVYDTLDWLWVPFAVTGLASALASLLIGIGASFFYRHRHRLFIWSGLSTIPIVASLGVAGYMFLMQARKTIPDNAIHKIGRMAAVTLFKGHARLLYVNRLETNRLVMYYDERVKDPAGDMAAMEKHLINLEKLLGRTQIAPIHWVRGGSFGMSAMSIHSVALGSNESPSSWFDRHEIAHSFLYQFTQPNAEPPTLLLEGWAIATDGQSDILASTARGTRWEIESSKGTSDGLRAVLGPDSYHLGTDHANAMAGAVVNFLLNSYGGNKFLDFYNGINPMDLDRASQQSLGVDFAELEKLFWKDVERVAERERAVSGLQAWVRMLEQEEVAETQTAKQRQAIRLVKSLNTDEAVDLIRGKLTDRLPEIATDVGLPPEECEKQLQHIASQLRLAEDQNSRRSN